jgi:transmembrane 9 superfamily protein 2/4
MRALLLFALCLTACTLLPIDAFYLPGVAPKDYNVGDPVELDVVKLTSVHTQLPYKYYTLPFCTPPGGIVDTRENLGEILMGDVIENSPYEIQAKINVTCKVLCTKVYKKKDLDLFAEKIEQEYRVHWLLDNLPSATKRYLETTDGQITDKFIYEDGFPLGVMVRIKNENGEDTGKVLPALNNHVSMTILFHEDVTKYEGLRIVGFEVEAKSKRHVLDYDKTSYPPTCTAESPGHQFVKFDGDQDVTIIYTYSVTWQYSPIRWASRWDSYFMMTDDQIHWFSIVNSVFIVFFLSGIVGLILMRALHADFRRYNADAEEAEEVLEETGWKLVHADVFRPPAYPMLLAVSVGSGVQTFAMAIITMVFAVLGFLSPANRGGLMTAMVTLLVIMGVFNGYYTARVYKMFKGIHWKKCIIMAILLYPGIAFSIFFILNLMLLSAGSSGAVHTLTLLELFGLWFGVSVPLICVGAFFGFKKPITAEPPNVRVNQIPRQIPEQVWYMRTGPAVLMGGILPFGAILIELFFIWTSIWLHQFYYLFSFLFIVFLILVITSAEITVVMCYFQLCTENYHWWWRAFLTPASASLYMFLFSMVYFFPKLQITKFVSFMLYFGYTAIICLEFFLLLGVIGFYAGYIFVYKIYNSIKVE